ncbi:MAG: hypothetical protein AAGE18_01700 [Pseudomonadota bacterium]
MEFAGVEAFRADIQRGGLAPGPVALIFAEDEVEVGSTVAHHRRLGFANIAVFGRAGDLGELAGEDGLHIVEAEVTGREWVAEQLNRLIDPLAGRWLYYGFNAEYLFFPYCETRRIGDLVAFMLEERRQAVYAYALDLYADDLGLAPSGVSRERAHFDGAGYYSFQRFEGVAPQDRQFDIFGGLGWRFEEHVPWERRRIDRISLFEAQAGLRIDPRFLLSEAEMNTVACPWHHNLTVAVMSFRVAKSLKRNPGSTYEINSFLWPLSTRFDWSSQQLMERGFIEPGQWF